MATIPGLWQVLVPLPGTTLTNLVTNPSPQLALTGYTTDQGGTTGLARDGTKQRRGAYAFKYTPTSGTNQGFYFALTLTSGHHYYFSCDLLGQSGVPYRIGIFNTSNVLQGNAALHTGTGYWAYDRLEADWTAGSTATFRLRIEKNGSADTNPFWADGLMLIDGTTGLTYFDGAQPGALWTGSPYASTSQSDPETREIGQLVDLSVAPYNFAIEGWAGTGLPPLRNVVLPYGLADGGYYQRTKAQPRSFNVSGNVLGTSQQALHADLKALTDALKPDLVARQVPTWWRYRGNTVVGSPPATARALWIKALVDGGLEDNYSIKAGFTMPLALKLLANDPYWYEEGWAARTVDNTITMNQAINDNGFASRVSLIVSGNAQGLWLATGAWGPTAPGPYQVNTTLFNPVDKRVYVGGPFAAFGGVSNTAGICAFNPTSLTISALGTGGSAGATVKALAIMPNGDVAVAGSFGGMGGVANTNSIALWQVASGAWSSISSGFTGTEIAALAVDAAGNLYVGGKFTNIGGVAAANFAKRTPAGTWSQPAAYGTGGTDEIFAMAVAPDGATVIVGGSQAGALSYIASWNGTALTKLGAGADATVKMLGYTRDGMLYVGGAFTNLGGISVQKLGRWNGAVYQSVGQTLDGDVLCMCQLADGTIIFGGDFTKAGTQIFSSRFARWTGSVWLPMDLMIGLTGTPTPDVLTFTQTPDGSQVVGFAGDGSSTIYSQQVVHPTIAGSATARLIIAITGPGTVHEIQNITGNTYLGFNGLTLAAGETAVLNLTPGQISFGSNFRRNLLNTIVPGGSLFNFALRPGAQYIGFLITDYTSATVFSMQWRNAFWSLDGGAN